ncbi:hypothetical protein B9Z65_1855 [Elsinoe australis]|uniref:Uncharacterized protein n=1 Tax=Elsinoe australis TaxID=40998 RepID=A0A2P7YL42_9PEZI|nr:hypothetical protein B9Z65_1855 [Elsinoe australis]
MPPLTGPRPSFILRSLRRDYSTPPSPAPSPPNPSKRISALARLQSKLPPRLRPYLSPLLSAPVSHVTSFLILHEITALLPLLGLFGVFHYSNAVWLDRWRDKVEQSENFQEGVKKWGRYARRKGWISDDEERVAEELAAGEGEKGSEMEVGKVTSEKVDSEAAALGRVYAEDGVTKGMDGRIEQLEGKLDSAAADQKETSPRGIVADTKAGKGARLVVELATAYAITKVMLPVRIVASVWATPWFARVAVQPVSSLARRVLGR